MTHPNRTAQRRAAALAILATGTLASPAARAADEEAEPAEPPKNWVELGGGSSFVSGSNAAFSERYQLPDGAFGGITSLHYEGNAATNTVFKVDARYIPASGNLEQDYSVTLDIAKEGLGYARGGISGFTTYYNAGGDFPAYNAWPGGLINESTTVDRREYWFEGGLRLPKWPEFTVRYSHQERDGTKGSTLWGPVTVPGDTRRITPSFYDLDEKRDSVGLDAKTFGKVDVNLGVRYDHLDYNNSLNQRLYPNEGAVNDSYGTQREQVTSDLLNFHGWAETRLNEKLRFTIGYAYTDLETDVTGYRVFGITYDPDLANQRFVAGSFKDLSGDSSMSQHVANLNAFYTVAKNLHLIPSSASKNKTATPPPSTPHPPPAPAASATPPPATAASSTSPKHSNSATPASPTSPSTPAASGSRAAATSTNPRTASTPSPPSSTDPPTTNGFRKNAPFGANWYPLRRFSLGAGYYHKIRENEFDHSTDNTSNLPASINRYPAYLVAQNYTVDDFNVRATWRPRNNLTLVGRYDFQTGTIENQADLLGAVDSADLNSQALSASLSWVPIQRLYLQGRVTFITDTTETPASGITASVQDAENDYWTTELTAGFALSDDVDLEATYFHYRADNYADNSTAGVPYNSGTTDDGISAGATWRINPRIRATARYAYYTSDDETYGGHMDYDAHTVYASVLYRF